MKSLIRFFYHQHLFGNLLTAMILIAGLISVFTIRKDLFPKVDFDISVVTAIYPGAAPEQIEKLLINPIEQALREVDGVKKIQSQALDSRAVVTVTLDPDARDPKRTHEDIQRAVDQVEDYPIEAEKPVAIALESGQTPVIELSITSDNLSELELRDLTRRVADELSNTKGVAKVVKDGWRKKEIQILVDQKKAVSQHISLSEIIDAVRGQNVLLPAGDMILPSGREVSVKTDGEYKSLETVQNTFIRSNFEGYGVRVSDVAEVREGLEKPSVIYKTNGQRSFKLTILKKEKADALKTVTAIKADMAKIAERLPPGVEYFFVNDFTFYLKNRLSTLGSNMVVGIFLVCAILALFLPFRVAIVVAIGIPVSMFMALITVQYYGYSLNLISLIGLIIVSGMLVDDTIVVTENIYRRLELGEDKETAIIEGAYEMVPAVVASVLTTVSAFGPMLFMSGIFGKFVFEIPLLVILPLLFSLFEAFLIAPGHMLTIVGNSVEAHLQKQKDGSAKAHWYTHVLIKYKNFIALTLQRRYVTLTAFFGILVLTGALVTQMKFVLFPPDGVYSFFVRVEGPAGATLEEMSVMLADVEAQIKQLPEDELVDYTMMLGIQQEEPNDPLTKRASHYSQILVNLSPEGERERSVDEVVADLREKIKKPENAVKLSFSIAQGGPPQGRPISINIFGEDFNKLKEIAGEIKAVMKDVDGVVDIEDSEVVGKKEFRVIPNSKAVSQVGLTVQDVATTVRAAFAGIVPSSLRNLDEEIDLRVQIMPTDKNATQQLRDVKVGNKQGNLIPLTKIASFEEQDSRLIVQHEKFKRIFNVSSGVDLERTTAIKATAEIQEKIKDLFKKYPEYEVAFSGENEDTAESMQSLLRAFGVAAVLIFMILILTFKSFIQPIIVLVALPLGFIGVVIALLIHGKPLSFMAMLGIIALAGVIVNNAIVYIDYFNTKKAEGLPLQTALIEAASTRLRPIILTSLTTVLGLMPTAYGIGGSDGFVMALALALGWGLMIGSVLTVMIFPALLHIIEDIKNVFSRKKHVIQS